MFGPECCAAQALCYLEQAVQTRAHVWHLLLQERTDLGHLKTGARLLVLIAPIVLILMQYLCVWEGGGKIHTEMYTEMYTEMHTEMYTEMYTEM